MNIIPREKKDYRKIFQKNVNKVSNILQLCKPKNKTIDPNISEHDINMMFSGIEKSCDSIIFEKENTIPSSVGLNIDSFDIDDSNSMNGEKLDSLNEEINNSNENVSLIIEELKDNKNDNSLNIITNNPINDITNHENINNSSNNNMSNNENINNNDNMSNDNITNNSLIDNNVTNNDVNNNNVNNKNDVNNNYDVNNNDINNNDLTNNDLTNNEPITTEEIFKKKRKYNRKKKQ